MAKARDFLAKARIMLDAGLPDEAGRAAYLAGFHAAQAVLARRSGRTAKTHSGVRPSFAAAVRDDPRFGPEQRAFLARGYGVKTVSDHGVDPALRVTPERAAEVMRAAERFVSAVEAALASGDGGDPEPPG